MKIYQVSYQDLDIGHIVEWHSSRTKAKKACARIRREYREKAKKLYDYAIKNYEECVDLKQLYSDPLTDIYEMKISPTKKGIIDFLNLYFTTDNG